MIENYKIQRATHTCTSTGREFMPGEEYYAVVVESEDILKRNDYSQEAWHGPPENALAWWKGREPKPSVKRRKLASNETLLTFFQQLYESRMSPDVLYILSLLLIRRRVLRLDEENEALSRESLDILTVYSPRTDETYHVPVTHPSESRQLEIQNELVKVLTGEDNLPGNNFTDQELEEEELLDPATLEMPEVDE